MEWERAVAAAVVLAVAGCGDNLPGFALDEPAIAISGSESTTCAIGMAGALWCWGDPIRGDWDYQLGEPMQVEGAWSQVAVGPTHACAIRDDGSLWCWGRNCVGQFGGNGPSSAIPVQVGTRDDYAEVAVGGGKTCAIDRAGAMTCWGGPDYGYNDCSAVPRAGTVVVPGTWSHVSAHWYAVHAIASDGTLWRMRDPDDVGTTWTFSPPVQVGAGTWTDHVTGLTSMCGISSDAAWLCVEFDGARRNIGTGTWTGPIASRDHHCGIKTDGSLWCIGRNDFGQSDPTRSGPDDVPLTRIGTAVGWTAVSAGYNGSCGIRDGIVECWGRASTVPAR